MPTYKGKPATKVAPLTPQPGDHIVVYSPLGETEKDLEWEEGIVHENNEEFIRFGAVMYEHSNDEPCQSVYYLVGEKI